MSTILDTYNKEKLAKLTANKEIPSFAAGDTLRIDVRITDGANQRVQSFEGLCIARRNASIGSTFTVRKISGGEGIEKTFLLYSPAIEKISVLRRGRVRRAKLYYMRDLYGKAARVKEKTSYGKPSKPSSAK